MPLDNERNATVYTGNGSTVVPYPAGFDYFDPEHVRVQVTLADDSVIDLGSSAYSVAVDGIRTAVAYGPEVTVKIYRLVPLTMPLSLPLAGALSPAAIERALVMVVQQIQQIARAVDGSGVGLPIGSGNALEDTAVWSDSVARLSVRPKRTGQMGVEFSTQTIWIAQSTVPGDWEEYAARPTIAKRVRIGFVADAGNATSPNQAAAVARLVSENVDFVVLGGDNTGYRAGDTYDSDHAAFRVFPASKRAEVWGNHDGPLALWQLRLATEYPNDPRNITGKPYGVISIGGLVDIFLLDSGMESDGTFTHPDGYAAGSPQHVWFAAAVAASTAPRKIAFFHHPMVSDAYGSNRVVPGMAWPELTHMDAIGCGHAHGLSMMDWRGTLLANCSHITQGADAVTWLLQGDAAETAKTKILYTNPDDTAVCIMDVTAEGVSVAFIRISDGVTLVRRNHNELLAQERTVQEYMIYNAAVPIESGVEHYAGTISTATFIERVMVSVASPSSGSIGCTLSAGGNIIATMIILAGNRYAETSSFALPGYFLIPVGTPLTLLINETAEYGATQATGLNLHLSTTHPKW